MLYQAVQNASETLWLKNINEWSFSWVSYHIIETADFYSRDTPNGMEWGKYTGINWKTDTEKEILEKKSSITKQSLLSYLEAIESRITQVLELRSESELFSKDGFEEFFPSILEKFLYLLRHDTYHLGELSKALRDHECKRLKWQ